MTATATRIELHGPLGEMFGREHFFYISSPGEAIRAMCSQFKGFRETAAAPGASYALLVGNQDVPLEALNIQSGSQDIHLVPVVEGGKSPWANVIIGAVLIAAVVLSKGAASPALKAWAAGSGGQFVFSMGVAMAISGAMQIISPAPPGAKPNERPENNPSDLFDGPVNTIAQNHPIQICYGEVEIGSAVISTMMDCSHGGGGRGEGSVPKDPWDYVPIPEHD